MKLQKKKLQKIRETTKMFPLKIEWVVGILSQGRTKLE